MSRLFRAIMAAAAPVVIAVVDTSALPALASPDCMTKQEAIKAFPGDHIYWHGPKRCWDNVGKSSAKKAAALKSADAAPAPSEAAKADVDTASEKAKPAEASSAPATRASVVPFIADDPSRLASWSAPSREARAQQDDPPPQLQSAAKAEDASIVIGAPNAAPGSPDYLLEHCCWPPTVPEQAANSALLPRMVIASAGACGLAAGLWLFVYRRRRPARARRVQLFPSIPPQDDMAMDAPPWAPSRTNRPPSAYQVSPLALHSPRRLRSPADELQDVS